MSEVFISYARSTQAAALRFADALRAAGYGVWRDDELPPHRLYADVIEERLGAAKAVLVIWSADAVKSDWVRAEADVARAAGKLVQLSLDGALTPLTLARGAELGRFNMGSTVILLLPPGRTAWLPMLAPGAKVRVGQALAHLT